MSNGREFLRVRLQNTQGAQEWFTKSTQYDDSPKIYIEDIVTKFIDEVKRFNLTLCVTNAEFYRAMCKLMCQMYHYKHKTHIEPYLDPISTLPKPSEWNAEHEHIWTNYIEYHYFNSDFWEYFWDFIPECHIDSTLRNWRTTLSWRMPQFISRDPSVISEDGIMEDEEYAEDMEEYDTSYPNS